MYLLNTATLKLEYFFGDKTPPYAILSHTWGEEEISYQDLTGQPTADAEYRKLNGWVKVSSFASLASHHGWKHVWVDTCCIDKKSSAELSEAINSMYRWYKDAKLCYVYLEDITVARSDSSQPKRKFVDSRWFERGWTLQELLAPELVEFYDRDWCDIGTKHSLSNHISRRTGIDVPSLHNQRGASVAAKLSWASSRVTSRPEDIAYCLLGLFDVHMPLLYGEGESKAFQRLQFEILQTESDNSIFAWTPKVWHTRYNLWLSNGSGLLARSPRDFSRSGDIVIIRDRLGLPAPRVTSSGDRVILKMYSRRKVSTPSERTTEAAEYYQLPLACARISDPHSPIMLEVKKTGEREFARIMTRDLEFFHDYAMLDPTEFTKQTISISQTYPLYWELARPARYLLSLPSIQIRLSPNAQKSFRILATEDTRTLTVHISSRSSVVLTRGPEFVGPAFEASFSVERGGMFRSHEITITLSGEALSNTPDVPGSIVRIGPQDRLSVALKSGEELRIVPRYMWDKDAFHLIVEVDCVPCGYFDIEGIL